MPLLTDPENATDLAWCRAFIARARWQTAKSDGDGRWPHSYTVRKWAAQSGFERDWEWFYHLINLYGTVKNFYRHRRPYLVVDDHEYWAIGTPIEESWIINRSHEVGKTHGRQTAHPTQTRRPVSMYDHLAGRYDGDYTEPQHVMENEQLAAWLREIIAQSSSPTLRTLDIGCGTGLLLDIVPELTPGYMGIDPSQGMVNAAVLKHQTAAFRPLTVSEYRAAGGRMAFDLVTALFSGQYLSIDEIEAIPELVKPDGAMLLIFNKPDYLPHYYAEADMEAHPWWVEREDRLDAAFNLRAAEVVDWGNYWVVRTP